MYKSSEKNIKINLCLSNVCLLGGRYYHLKFGLFLVHMIEPFEEKKKTVIKKEHEKVNKKTTTSGTNMC